MSCERHPHSGVVQLGGEEHCYGCYCELFDYCPSCGYGWSDPRECGMIKTREDKMTTLYEINTRNRTPRMETWWECYVEGTDGGRHYHHWTLQSAKTEAERLARLTRGTIYVFECIGKCKSDIKWETPTLW